MLKINLKKYIILMHFQAKNTLKHNIYHSQTSLKKRNWLGTFDTHCWGSCYSIWSIIHLFQWALKELGMEDIARYHTRWWVYCYCFYLAKFLPVHKLFFPSTNLSFFFLIINCLLPKKIIYSPLEILLKVENERYMISTCEHVFFSFSFSNFYRGELWHCWN